MKVKEFIKGFEGTKNYSLNLRDQDDCIWFFGDMKDAMERVPKFSVNKQITRFNVVPVPGTNSTIIMAIFKD